MNKYKNIRTEVDGIKFASKKEAARYKELKLLEKAGKISDLELQPSFTFSISDPFESVLLRYPSGRVVKYIADFAYHEINDHAIIIGEKHYNRIIEDVKGIQTPVFKLKAALMKDVNGIEVRIT